MPLLRCEPLEGQRLNNRGHLTNKLLAVYFVAHTGAPQHEHHSFASIMSYQNNHVHLGRPTIEILHWYLVRNHWKTKKIHADRLSVDSFPFRGQNLSKRPIPVFCLADLSTLEWYDLPYASV